ncbi:MAG: YihY/virulence factor BrkB family protein [Mogibacterium sp.]|nr:YihY/virulence factor BrkB family protein [Mogibacterium sp.]
MSDFWRNTVQENNEENHDKLPLTWERARKIGFHLWRQFDDPYYAGFAAQIAYFFFMASVPMLIVLTQVLGIFDISMDFIKDWLEEHLSTEMGSFLSSLFNASSTAASNIFLIILALWAASSLAFSLSRLTTYTLSYGRYRFNFFVERAKAIPMAMLSILAVAVTLLVYVYGTMIAKSVFHSKFLVDLITSLRTPLMGVLFFVIILANYYLLPRIRVPLAAVLPGAVIATLGILLVTWIYSLYTSKSSNYNLLYGAFSNIVAMMLWFYLISWVLCIGMMFNKSWDIHMRRGRLTPAKIRKYIIKSHPAKGEEMFNKLIIGDYDMTDRSLDSLAVKASRKFDPGYAEKREREIRELQDERRIRLRIEKEIADELHEYPLIESDPPEDEITRTEDKNAHKTDTSSDNES